MNNTNDYTSVTEISGDDVSQEQVERMCERYYWAGEYCSGKDVLEAACGAGQGIGYLQNLANSFEAGDYSGELVDIAKQHYGERVNIYQFDAQDIPKQDNSMDVIILFEALYYIPDAEKFIRECKRILRPGGHVLIATANKDLFDFNPSPYTFKYYGVVELNRLFSEHGFTCEFYGGTSVAKVSWKQKILRPIKKIVVALNFMPKTMAGKKLMKRLVFGKLVPLPAEIKDNTADYNKPTTLGNGKGDLEHKVIYCSAKLN